MSARARFRPWFWVEGGRMERERELFDRRRAEEERARRAQGWKDESCLVAFAPGFKGWDKVFH